MGRLKRPLRDHSGRLLDPTVIGGLAAGVAVMYITGGAGIHGFTFVLLLGILVGTYSSIAIAAPILLFHARRQAAESTQHRPVGRLQRA